MLSAAFGARAHLVPLLARLLLGGVIFAAGALKVAHPSDLAATITVMKLGLPGQLVASIAVALPPFEMLLGVYLIGGWLLAWSSVVASALLGAFILALISMLLRGIHANCGCFGVGAEPTTWLTVLRDGSFIIPALYLAWWSRIPKDDGT